MTASLFLGVEFLLVPLLGLINQLMVLSLLNIIFLMIGEMVNIF